MPRKNKSPKVITHSSDPLKSPRESPLVFISHDTRDADLAEAFANLLTDASGGMLKSFRSSDRKGTSGIEFGQEWYKAIMTNLTQATDVVALLTPHSLDRPWILYESGVAKGALDTTVLGVAIGIPLEKAQTGPFAQFQNCGDDEDSLTKLVIQLIRRNPNASPRAEAVGLQVRAFREKMAELLKGRDKVAKPEAKINDAVIAKMFEEVKVLVRDLPERLEIDRPEQRRKMRRIHPGMFLELARDPAFRGRGAEGFPVLLYLGYLRNDLPWLYEFGLEFYRALRRGSEREIARSYSELRHILNLATHHPAFFELMGGRDQEGVMYFRHFLEDFERFLHRLPREKRPAKEDEEDEKKDS